MTSVEWLKCIPNDQWCSLKTLNLVNLSYTGAYVIWHAGNPPRILYVGQGMIGDRLRLHRKDPRLLQYKTKGDLKVTWAKTDAFHAAGIVRYLSDHWAPLVEDGVLDVEPIAVNSPFAA